MRTRATSVLALLLALTLLATGCSSGSGKQPREPAGPSGQTATTSQELVALLAGAGIGTYADATANRSRPPCPSTRAARTPRR